jgi:hypothetical protein
VPSYLRMTPRHEAGEPGSVVLPLDGFAWRELERESARHEMDPSELASFAILYYLADADSGRIARRITGFGEEASQAAG